MGVTALSKKGAGDLKKNIFGELEANVATVTQIL